MLGCRSSLHAPLRFNLSLIASREWHSEPVRNRAATSRCLSLSENLELVPMELNTITYEIRGPMALITINRPDKHNAISLGTLRELHQAVDCAADDDTVRALVITGAGGQAFAAGSDLSEVINPLGKCSY